MTESILCDIWICNCHGTVQLKPFYIMLFLKEGLRLVSKLVARKTINFLFNTWTFLTESFNLVLGCKNKNFSPSFNYM